MELSQHIEELVLEKIKGTDVFLVDIVTLPNKKIQIFIDSDSGITVDICAEINRHLRNHLDNEGLFERNLDIEVSSPGLDSPLKLLRQYKKNINRQVKVSLNNGEQKTGTLTEVDDDFIVIEERIKSNNKKNKQEKKKITKLYFNMINKTNVVVSLN